MAEAPAHLHRGHALSCLPAAGGGWTVFIGDPAGERYGVNLQDQLGCAPWSTAEAALQAGQAHVDALLEAEDSY